MPVMLGQVAQNRQVDGSSPSQGAIEKPRTSASRRDRGFSHVPAVSSAVPAMLCAPSRNAPRVRSARFAGLRCHLKSSMSVIGIRVGVGVRVSVHGDHGVSCAVVRAARQQHRHLNADGRGAVVPRRGCRRCNGHRARADREPCTGDAVLAPCGRARGFSRPPQAAHLGLGRQRPIAASSALGGVTVNGARAVGPALAGVVLSVAGAPVVFGINALSFVAAIVALWWWKRPQQEGLEDCEAFGPALRAGVRYVASAGLVRRILLRSALFALPASALWALLPVLTGRDREIRAAALAVCDGVPVERHCFANGDPRSHGSP